MKEKELNLLIVNDSVKSLDLLAKSLPFYYKRQFALSAEKALSMIKNNVSEPDIVIIDVKDEHKCFELCRILKSHNDTKDIYIFVTNFIESIKYIKKIYEMGGIEYIKKPFELNELIARLEGCVKRSLMDRELKDKNINLLQLAERRTNEIMKSQMATVYALAKLADLRDSYTGSHLERVALMSGLIARKYMESENEKNVNDEYISILKQASILHDIGKVGISDNILMKNGKLTNKEFDLIKKHTEIGAMTIKSVYDEFPNNDFLGMAVEIAKSHHEKWNGEGYPEGLKGTNIPFCARIVALVDNYDAIRSKRPYKNEVSHEESIKKIKSEKGKSFDPMLVDLFIEAEKEIDEVYKNEFAIGANY